MSQPSPKQKKNSSFFQSNRFAVAGKNWVKGNPQLRHSLNQNGARCRQRWFRKVEQSWDRANFVWLYLFLRPDVGEYVGKQSCVLLGKD